MQYVYFVVAAVVLYFVSDRILAGVEKARGEVFEYRSLVFFVIMLVLTLTAFKAIELWSGG